MLNQDGTIDMGNIDYHYRPTDDSDPFQTDIVTLSGRGDFFAPKFNYKGFQYVEVTSSKPLNLTDESLIAIEMHSDVPQVGYLHSSSDLINKIWKLPIALIWLIYLVILQIVPNEKRMAGQET